MTRSTRITREASGKCFGTYSSIDEICASCSVRSQCRKHSIKEGTLLVSDTKAHVEKSGELEDWLAYWSISEKFKLTKERVKKGALNVARTMEI